MALARYYVRIKVSKRVLIPEELEGGIVIGDVSYVCRESDILVLSYGVIVGSDRYDKWHEVFSYDNGKTWTKTRYLFSAKQTKKGVYRYSGLTYFLDEEKDTLIMLYDRGFYPEDTPTKALWQVYWRILDKSTFEWSPEKEVRALDTDDEKYIFPGVMRGSLAISRSVPIKTKQGKILVPCQLKAMDDKGNIWFPFSHYFSPFYESAFLIGEWKHGEIVWEISEKITIDPYVSCRLCEPTVVELKDGRLFTIMRGDNGAFPEKPGYKWYSISEDGGYTWTPPKPLKYDDGSPLYSPSSCSLLFRNTRTGKVYWIANIVDKNPVGNRPRYPLCIAEIDEEKLAVKKKTVTIIDTKRPEDSPMVQLSNFRSYEDRKTGDIVLFMARYGERGNKGDLIIRSPLYMYRIRLINDEC
ncbi:MAG TPA: exo-alpha-sialidase [Thermoprotei archaeon]|nr:exo-alpha-sialidase [Thermoprotei archaeon]